MTALERKEKMAIPLKIDFVPNKTFLERLGSLLKFAQVY